MADSYAARPIAELVDLASKRALVTGAAQGFGAAIARRLAEAGADVLLADRNDQALQHRHAALTNEGLTVTATTMDVTDEEQVAAVVAEWAPIDVLVNNAGVFSNYLMQLMPRSEFRRIMDVNVTGAFTMSQKIAESLLSLGRSGAIVNIASVDAFHPSAEGLVHYTTSKHAVAGLTRSLAMELAPNHIRVNAVCPGAAMTEGAIQLVTQGAPEGIDVATQWDGIKDRIPMGRLCEPDDVARAALFLASDMAEFITGALVVVDGGMLVQPLEGYIPVSAAD